MLNQPLPSSAYSPAVPIPNQPWRYYQEWNKALFFHWPAAIQALSDLVPKGLQIDTYQGQAWISVVPFVLEGVRPRYFPAIRAISDFPELNIRTYVLRDGVPGVYFLSIEAGKRFGGWLAKTISGLPYSFANILHTPQEVSVRSPQNGSQLSIRYHLGSRYDRQPIDYWLTERYAIHQQVKGRLRTYTAQHAPWELQELHVSKFEFRHPPFDHLISGLPARMAYAEGVKVHAWDPY